MPDCRKRSILPRALERFDPAELREVGLSEPSDSLGTVSVQGTSGLRLALGQVRLKANLQAFAKFEGPASHVEPLPLTLEQIEAAELCGAGSGLRALKDSERVLF